MRCEGVPIGDFCVAAGIPSSEKGGSSAGIKSGSPELTYDDGERESGWGGSKCTCIPDDDDDDSEYGTVGTARTTGMGDKRYEVRGEKVRTVALVSIFTYHSRNQLLRPHRHLSPSNDVQVCGGSNDPPTRPDNDNNGEGKQVRRIDVGR